MMDAFVNFLEDVFEIFLVPFPIGVGSEQHSFHLSNRKSAGGPIIEDMVRFPCIHPSPQALWRQSPQLQLLPALVGILYFARVTFAYGADFTLLLSAHHLKQR